VNTDENAYFVDVTRGSSLAPLQRMSLLRASFCVLLLAVTACAKSANITSPDDCSPRPPPSPSGMYRAQMKTLTNTCPGLDVPGAGEPHFFVMTSLHNGSVHANLPLAFDGLAWEELASRATIDFDHNMTLVDAPAPRCPSARRRREIHVDGARPTGFDLDLAETWSIPNDADCELPAEAPRVSCARVRRVELFVERECSTPVEVASLQCLRAR
jgi:hypothetical protein